LFELGNRLDDDVLELGCILQAAGKRQIGLEGATGGPASWSRAFELNLAARQTSAKALYHVFCAISEAARATQAT
jgi:hypothetical protein